MTVNKIGRDDGGDKVKTSSVTASGTAAMVPVMGRRSYIKIANVGSVVIEVGGEELFTVSGTVGFLVAATTGTWEDNTDAPIYVKSTGADSELRIYERASR